MPQVDYSFRPGTWEHRNAGFHEHRRSQQLQSRLEPGACATRTPVRAVGVGPVRSGCARVMGPPLDRRRYGRLGAAAANASGRCPFLKKDAVRPHPVTSQRSSVEGPGPSTHSVHGGEPRRRSSLSVTEPIVTGVMFPFASTAENGGVCGGTAQVRQRATRLRPQHQSDAPGRRKQADRPGGGRHGPGRRHHPDIQRDGGRERTAVVRAEVGRPFGNQRQPVSGHVPVCLRPADAFWGGGVARCHRLSRLPGTRGAVGNRRHSGGVAVEPLQLLHRPGTPGPDRPAPGCGHDRGQYVRHALQLQTPGARH